MSDEYFTAATAAIPTWAIKPSIVFVNPANPDDKMEFDSIEALNAEMFRLKAEVERLNGGTIQATWVVSEQDAERIKARLEREKGGRP